MVRILQEATALVEARGPIWKGTAANFKLYFSRRGGATLIYTRARDLNYVAIQGRWKINKTIYIYLDNIRAILLNFSYPPPSSFVSPPFLIFGDNSDSSTKGTTWVDWKLAMIGGDAAAAEYERLVLASKLGYNFGCRNQCYYSIWQYPIINNIRLYWQKEPIHWEIKNPIIPYI